MPSNTAAWIKAPKEQFKVEEAPYPSPGAKDVIVKTAAVAINPMDYKIQDSNPAIGGNPLQYPTILGSDLAGTVVEVGNEVTKWKVGDRIIAHCFGAAVGKPGNSAYQHFVSVPDWVPTPVPEAIALHDAVVLPLAIDTAMAGLFVQLGLPTSTLGTKSSTPEKQVILVWGGSSSVGCAAIQLARAAGYQVFATASSRNHALCKSLGATAVFDYTSSNVEKEVAAALKGKHLAGAFDCIADNDKTIPTCARILKQDGVEGKKKIVAVLNPATIEGVETERVSIPALMYSEQYTQVKPWIAAALKEGTLQCQPKARVVGKDLQSIQEGVDILRKGVSAAKIVVRLE